jgi:hypothetical protein
MVCEAASPASVGCHSMRYTSGPCGRTPHLNLVAVTEFVNETADDLRNGARRACSRCWPTGTKLVFSGAIQSARTRCRLLSQRCQKRVESLPRSETRSSLLKVSVYRPSTRTPTVTGSTPVRIGLASSDRAGALATARSSPVRRPMAVQGSGPPLRRITCGFSCGCSQQPRPVSAVVSSDARL